MDSISNLICGKRGCAIFRAVYRQTSVASAHSVMWCSVCSLPMPLKSDPNTPWKFGLSLMFSWTLSTRATKLRPTHARRLSREYSWFRMTYTSSPSDLFRWRNRALITPITGRSVPPGPRSVCFVVSRFSDWSQVSPSLTTETPAPKKGTSISGELYSSAPVVPWVGKLDLSGNLCVGTIFPVVP